MLARRVVVAADQTKVGRSTFARICALDDVDVFVTDAALPERAAVPFEKAGVEAVVADVR